AAGGDRAADPAADDPPQAPEVRDLIAAQSVTKRFGDFVALEDVSLDVPDGSLTALLGPSGSGKSTLLRIIAGLETPTAGSVIIGGQDVTSLPPQKREIGFVFQHYAAFKHMTVRDNVAFGLKIRKQPRDRVRSRVDELLEIVGLTGWADRYPGQLSGGQRQRMALAPALAVDRAVLLLDEPFGALDANVRQELREWLRRLHDEVHVTTVIVTHDQEEAMAISDRIVVLDHGRVQQTGEPREVYEQPANEFVMGFLGPVSKLGEALVGPHDLVLSPVPVGGGVEAQVTRVVYLGFEVRVELDLARGESVSVQLTRAEADELELAEGDITYVRPTAEPAPFSA